MPDGVEYHKNISIEKTLEENLFFILEIKSSPGKGRANEHATRPIHRHPFYEVIFVTQGECVIEVDFKEYTLKRGCMTLFSPLQIHHPRQVKGDYKCFLIRFYPNLFDSSEFLKELKLFDYDFLSLSENHFSKCKLLAQELEQEFKNDFNFKDVILGNLLKCFLITIKRAIPENVYEKSYEDTFSKLNFLIVENDFKISKPSEYAEKLRIPPRSLNEITKKHAGISAGEYIRTKTIFEAKRLLTYTSLTVKEVAYKLGFDDVAYFSRFFKKATDISALQYREENTYNSESEEKSAS